MKFPALLLVFLFVNLAIAQTPSTIEISVDETIERPVETIHVQLFLLTAEAQMSHIEDDYDLTDFEYDPRLYVYTESDWEYKEMLNSTPELITDEMRAEHEKRDKLRADQEKVELKMKLERDRKIAEFKATTLNDIRKILDKNKFIYKIVKNAIPTKDDYFSLYSDNDGYLPDAFQLDSLQNEDWIRLNDIFNDESMVKQKIVGLNFRSNTNQLNSVIPRLTNKAKYQANLLVVSLNRKLGEVISCSNVYPSIISPPSMSTLTNNLDELMSENLNGYQAFAKTKKEIIQFIFKFELL